MRISTVLGNQEFVFETGSGHDISIPLEFNGEQPNTYGVEFASAKAYRADAFIGDTRMGGGCNFEQLKITPHCNGTHTEGVGHITDERISINEQLKDSLIPATLITVAPKKAANSNETYKPVLSEEDFFITSDVLKGKLADENINFMKALVIRTQPNDNSKMSRNYMKNNPPFFSFEAMRYIVSLGIEHLLVDIPSVDRMMDQGKLNAHHIFWKLKEDSHELEDRSAIHKTITEMIYVKNTIHDGKYLLNLQIAPFQSDASPSRPILYPVINYI